ncbi:MAG: AzlD domain-containing protein [Deltaproteobacteria bacterium]|nr:AzlD domain-containing protein [Deltaproteobacteria bacterium]
MDYVILIALMGAVTYLPRWMPLFFLSRYNLPGLFVEWLELIPASILAAILLPALIVTGEPRSFDPFGQELLVALPTFLFALMTRSLGGTVVVGMLLYWLAGKMF